MMITFEQFYLYIIAYLVNQVDFQERLPTDKIPYYTLFLEILLMVKNVINSLLGNLPGHPLFRVLSHEVAVFTSQLTILGDNEGDILGDA